MTGAEFLALQEEWELHEFCGHDLNVDRQAELDVMMDESGWAIHPDTGEAIREEELKNI